MREIKFRFYNTKLRRMSKGSHGLGVIWEYLVDEWGIFDWKDVVKEQFTGLHDAKGREIYEGDVMEWHFDGNEYRQAVEWETIWKVSRWPSTAEVIGNIHEGEG